MPEVDALSQYLATDGELGECPDYYGLIQASKYLNCKPWELWEQPLFWRIAASRCMRADESARKTLEARRK
jgi:hypothetical protein